MLLRLLYPGTVLSSSVSVQSAAEQTEVVRNFEAVRGVDTIEYMGDGSVEGFNRYAPMPERPVTVAEQVTPERFERMKTTAHVRDALEPIWIVGIVATFIVFAASNVRFYNAIRKRRKPLDTDCPLRVYAVENLSSSCLFGNVIYVAAETAADETRLRHVLEHELSHHRHGDHVWTLLRCIALALHWYNPLVWWAAALSRQDSELCADAGALKRLGEDERESYGATLIELSARRAPRASLLCTATTMTNGKKSLKERVTMIARRPRTTAAVVIAVVLAAAVAAGCAFAGAKEQGNEVATDHLSEEEVPSSQIDYAETGAEFHYARGTVFTYNGVGYDLTEQYGDINAITDIRKAGKYLVIDGHVGPRNGMYCIFDTETGSFVKSFPGANLIWQGDDLMTGVYSYWNRVYDYNGRILGEVPLTWADYIESLRFTGGELEIEGYVDVTLLRDDRTLSTLLALDGRDMRVEFVNVLGRNGFYVNYLYETPESNWDVRDYYTTDVNGNYILMAESMAVDSYVDLDGDGIRELVCDVARPDGWEGTLYYRLNDELTVERAEIANGEELTDDAYEYFATLPLKDGPLMVNGGDTMLVYSNLLRELYVGLSENGDAELPLGVGTLQGNRGAQSENKFAICDVDGDGVGELLLRYTTSSMAGMGLYVYHYNVHDDLRFEFSEFPDVTFYDNGALAAGWSYNQVGSKTIWPYHRYSYHAASDSYRYDGYALSWEKRIRNSDPMGDALVFPDELDLDGDGVLYCVSDMEHYHYLDNADYDAWVASWRGDAQEIVPEWQDFTVRNIDALTR